MRLFILTLAWAATVSAAPIRMPGEDARRIEVLFFGIPAQVDHDFQHEPITGYRMLKKAFGLAGINLTYHENPVVVWNRETLDHFDAVMMYGKSGQPKVMPPEQLSALFDYLQNGGGLLSIHGGSSCYHASPEFMRLIGLRNAPTGNSDFEVRNVMPEHPILKGMEHFRQADGIRIDNDPEDDREILQLRGSDPWSWTRTHGQGRVFHTAIGNHPDDWNRSSTHDLLRNAIHWAIGTETYQLMRILDPPIPEDEDASLPGYRERREITRAQKPLSAAESIKLAQIPPGMEIALFASEPDIINPIHIAWDDTGRAFVIETVDYPNHLQDGNAGNDRITICEDTTGDGMADKFTRFAERLSIPTSMVFARGGVIATNGTEMIFLKDGNGDGHADQREVLFTGMNMHDTHAGVSNLRFGIDGWIYATIGYSGFDGVVGGVRHRFGQGVFRFQPDGSAIEFLQATTNNTWGLGFTEEFDVMGSTANANPSWFMSFPEAAYKASGLDAPRTPRADDNPFFNPMSLDIRQVDAFDRYTSAAGHAVYTSRRFPEAYWNRAAFVAEPTGKLVGHFDMHREGAGWKAVHSANNLYASADAWSAPVFADVGPDGAIWICDWYNIIVQHNPTPSRASAGVDRKTGSGNAYVTPLRDKQHGRIYRVYPKESENDINPGLDPKHPETLVAGLSHSNQPWRLHAQRLLVESGDRAQTGSLAALLKGDDPLAAAHALHALAGLGTLERPWIESALTSPYEGLRRAALSLAWPDEIKRSYLRADGINARGRELADVMVALASGGADPDFAAALLRIAIDDPDVFHDPVMADAWRIATRRHPKVVLAVAASLEFLPHHHLDQELQELSKHATQRDSGNARQIIRKFNRDEDVHARGKEVYALTCIACHGVDGQGVPEAFPPLDGTERIQGDPQRMIKIVLHGMTGPLEIDGIKFDGAMPPLGSTLSDRQVADVLTFIRQNWSNDAAPVSAEAVAQIRALHHDRMELWTPDELNRK